MPSFGIEPMTLDCLSRFWSLDHPDYIRNVRDIFVRLSIIFIIDMYVRLPKCYCIGLFISCIYVRMDCIIMLYSIRTLSHFMCVRADCTIVLYSVRTLSALVLLFYVNTVLCFTVLCILIHDSSYFALHDSLRSLFIIHYFI